MSETTKPAQDVAAAPAPGKPKKRSLFGKIRVAILLLLLLAVTAIQPPVFRRLVAGTLRFTAWRDGVSLQFGKVTGSIFEPVAVQNVIWSRNTESGTKTRIEVRRARLWLAWSNLFPDAIGGWIRFGAEKAGLTPIGKNGRWFQELELDDVTAKVSLPTSGPRGISESAFNRWLRHAFGEPDIHPSRITVRNGDLILVHGSDYVRARKTRLSLNEIDPGIFATGELIWKTGTGSRVFPNVFGRTSMRDSDITFAGLQLTPDVTVQTFTVSPDKLALSANLSAFGGRIEAEAESFTQDGRWGFDATGTFSSINIAGLAAFLNLGDAAGGILKEGRFSFRGSPDDPAHAEATVRLEAGAFQWESRQWDSLVLGFSLFDQRLQIPELRLRQGKNELSIKGTMALPQPGARWWERQFDLKVEAAILNLTDLSALILPDFKYAAGQLFIRGSVSGTGADGKQPAKYDGQLIVNGSGLKWRTAPVDVLHASLLFHDRDLEIISAHLLHDDDFLRGSGRISLVGGGYDGECRLSAKDLAIYKAVLSPALLPTPLAGGVNVTWSGKGTASAHEGRFTAQINRFHLLGPQSTLPLDAECNGTYRPGEVQLEKLKLSENGTTLAAGVKIAPGIVNVHGLRVQHRNRVLLEGDALLPLNLWKNWPDVTFPGLLNEETITCVHLDAGELDLGKASRLTGIAWPLAGAITGEVNADGALKSLKLGGTIRLTRGTIPLNWQGGIVSDVEAAFTLDGATVRLDKAIGKHSGGDFDLAGRMDLTTPRAPSLEAEGTGIHNAQPFHFTIKGPAAAPAIAVDGASPFPGNTPAPVPPPPAPAAK